MLSPAMLRSLPRACPSSCIIRNTSLRSPLRAQLAPASASIFEFKGQSTRSASSTHAISNPTLADIERRWDAMPPQEQAELWMALRDRMKNDWSSLTVQEKRAAYWVAFGPHGPRANPYPREVRNKIYKQVAAAVAISVVIFWAIRQFARPPPKTMNAQWQEMSNEYLRNQNVEPITGLSSQGYKGKGQVQSAPRKGGIPQEDDE